MDYRIRRADGEQLHVEGSLLGNECRRSREVVEKILFQHEIFGHDRFLVQFTIGGIPHEGVLRSIERLGHEVAPAVRDELALPRAAAV